MASWRLNFQTALWGAVLLGAVAAASALVWHKQSSPGKLAVMPTPPPPVSGGSNPPAPEPEGWTGSRKCAACHREIWESYQSHPMAQSAAAVLGAAIVEDYSRRTSFSKPESRTYRVERTPEHIWHHESMTDADGKIVYDQAVEVHYAIGSGKRGRTYLIDCGGVFKLSPITWYTQGQQWDLSPGYQPRIHRRFDRRAIDECLMCHVGRLSYEQDKPNRFREPPLLEAAIGCERCHGPGREHVRRQESTDAADSGADAIVNPARLEPGAREDVCNQCHLLGERILRHGRTDYDFRPGQRLEENWTVFVSENSINQDDTTRAVGHVVQMRESVCFKQSQGRLGCISCHDPHASPPAPDRRVFFDNRCTACHADRGCSLAPAERSAAPAAGSCITCHMPRLAASNVPHTLQTDHRIRRRSTAPGDTVANGDVEFFDHAESRLPQVDLVRVCGLMQARQVLSRRDASSAARLESQLLNVLERYPDDAEVLVTLGSLCMIQRRPEDARRHWLTLLDLRPEHEGALQQMAIFEKELGHTAEAIAYLRKSQVIDPGQADLYGLLGQLLWNAGRREEAVATASEGLKLDPRLIPLRKWLAGALRQVGHFDAADEQDRMLQRMQGR